MFTLTNGAITLNPGAISVAGTYTVTVEATGYADASIVQHVIADDGNMIKNGDFSNGMENWSTVLIDGADNGNMTVSAVNGALEANCRVYDGWFIWSTQVIYGQLGLVSGKTYTLSFDIKSTLTAD